jgi:polysaccharide export outer membrane protein
MKMEPGTSRVALIGILVTGMLALGSEAQTRPQPKVAAPAQTSVESAASPSILVSPSEDYRIGARDVIEIKVDDAPELSITVPVNADGTFLMPYLKRLKAEGKTPEELAREIADRIRGRYLKEPNVMVAVKQFSSRSIFVLGAVKSPGVYQIEGKASLLRLITLAGGPAENYGSVAFIIHEIRKRPVSSTTESANAGDPNAEPEFEVRTLNIAGMFKGIGLVDPKSYLEPGDIVHIPRADVFFVAGEVNAPGSFPLTEGTTLRQAIALSQGTTLNASLGNGVIFRQDPATGKRLEINVDIGAVMKGRKDDVPILANDMVIVSNSRAKSVGNSILKALGMGTAQRGIYR